MQVPYKEIGKICVSIKTRLYEKVMPSQFCSALLKVLYIRLAIIWNSNAGNPCKWTSVFLKVASELLIC